MQTLPRGWLAAERNRSRRSPGCVTAGCRARRAARPNRIPTPPGRVLTLAKARPHHMPRPPPQLLANASAKRASHRHTPPFRSAPCSPAVFRLRLTGFHPRRGPPPRFALQCIVVPSHPRTSAYPHTVSPSDAPYPIPRIHAVDLFCGIGGLTHGLRLAGVAVKAGFDTDPTCRHAFQSNNDATFFCKDVRNVHFRDLRPHYAAADVTALVGCAPCQPFSAHNRRRRRSDADCSLVAEFARLVREATPDLVSMENVPGLANHPAFHDFLETLAALRYTVNPTFIVSCQRYGVPQRRRRLVLLASRHGPISLPDSDAPKATVRDYIEDLPPIQHGTACPTDAAHAAMRLSPTNLDRVGQSKPGGSWTDWDDHLVNDCHRKAHYPGPYGRMRWDDLAPTITTQFCYYSTGRFGHPEQDRAISVREGALLQTFPRHYVLVDEENPLTIRELARHIGNAVPVALGQAIGTAFMGSANDR